MAKSATYQTVSNMPLVLQGMYDILPEDKEHAMTTNEIAAKMGIAITNVPWRIGAIRDSGWAMSKRVTYGRGNATRAAFWRLQVRATNPQKGKQRRARTPQGSNGAETVSLDKVISALIEVRGTLTNLTQALRGIRAGEKSELAGLKNQVKQIAKRMEGM